MDLSKIGNIQITVHEDNAQVIVQFQHHAKPINLVVNTEGVVDTKGLFEKIEETITKVSFERIKRTGHMRHVDKVPELFMRVVHILHANNIMKLGHLTKMTRNDVAKLKGIGVQAMTNIDHVMNIYGLSYKKI